MNSKYVFLDRDGTINVDFGYVCCPDRVVLIDGAAAAIASLKEAGFLVVVISNQSAIGRGLARPEDVEAVNSRIQNLLVAEDPNATLDCFLYSPDAPWQDSATRKPQIGLLHQLDPDFTFDPCRSFVVGDKTSDLQFGINAGLPEDNCYLVGTGDFKEQKLPPTYLRCNLFPSLKEAALDIISVNGRFRTS